MNDPLFDRMKRSFAVLVRAALPQIDHLAFYPSTVNGQNPDGTLELTPDNPRVASHSGVPIRYGEPGVAATVAAGARVFLFWAEGDPAMPRAALWEMKKVSPQCTSQFTLPSIPQLLPLLLTQTSVGSNVPGAVAESWGRLLVWLAPAVASSGNRRRASPKVCHRKGEQRT